MSKTTTPPFNYILASPSRQLCEGGDALIIDSIQDTYDVYEHTVTKSIFKTMIYRLTCRNGYNSYISYNSALLNNHNNINILNTICIFYPNYLDEDNINNIIGSLNTHNCSIEWINTVIDTIINTTYKFSNSQTITICSMGYNLVDKIAYMEYDDLLYFIGINNNNKCVYSDFIVSYDNKTVDKAIDIIQLLVKKHNIHVSFDIVDILLIIFKDTRSQISITILHNFHKLMYALEHTFIKKDFMYILSHFTIIDDLSEINNNGITINSIYNFYDDINLNRDEFNNILFNKNYSPELLLKNSIDSKLIKHDMDIDIFYIVLETQITRKNILFCTLIDTQYIPLNNKTLLLASILSNERFIRKCIESGLELTDTIIRTIYTFCNDSNIITLLREHKAIPTLEYVKCCTSVNILRYIQNNMLFMDPGLIDYCTSVINLEKGQFTILLNDDKFIKIYDSLNTIDKKKLEHIQYNDILDAKTIIMYDIKLTDIYVKQILYYSWIELIKLLYTSKKYQYITDYITIESIQYMSSNLGRIWIFNNIINNNYNFYDSIYLTDNSYLVKYDIDKLFDMDIINNIQEIRQTVDDAIINKYDTWYMKNM